MVPESGGTELAVATGDMITIGGGELSAVIVPRLGGRVHELTDLRRGRQWLWKNPNLATGPVPAGATYDDHWQGGFEELFPSDAPDEIGGFHYPDHGELWSIAWGVDLIEQDEVKLSVIAPVTGTHVAKAFSIEGPRMTVRYTLENTTPHALPYLFKLHPALAVHERCRIDLPGGLVEKVESGFGNLLSNRTIQPWPTDADLSTCRSESSGTNEFVYVSDLPVGRCGISDYDTGSKLTIDYPLDVFPYCWLFLTYGGWLDQNVAVLEPCTNYPKDLPAAMRSGTAASLAGESSTCFEVGFVVGPLDTS